MAPSSTEPPISTQFLKELFPAVTENNKSAAAVILMNAAERLIAKKYSSLKKSHFDASILVQIKTEGTVIGTTKATGKEKLDRVKISSFFDSLKTFDVSDLTTIFNSVSLIWEVKENMTNNTKDAIIARIFDIFCKKVTSVPPIIIPNMIKCNDFKSIDSIVAALKTSADELRSQTKLSKKLVHSELLSGLDSFTLPSCAEALLKDGKDEYQKEEASMDKKEKQLVKSLARCAQSFFEELKRCTLAMKKEIVKSLAKEWYFEPKLKSAATSDDIGNYILWVWIRYSLKKLTHFAHYEIIPLLKTKQQDVSQYCLDQMKNLREQAALNNGKVSEADYAKMQMDITHRTTSAFQELMNAIYPSSLK